MSLDDKDAINSHRLFVGGLYTGITEEELTNRLKKFGTIKNVFIHERQNEDGAISKTFAVFDMETSTKNLSRCCTAYSNTVWKGNTMRIEKYKDDPFERTRKNKETPPGKESLLVPAYIKQEPTEIDYSDPYENPPSAPRRNSVNQSSPRRVGKEQRETQPPEGGAYNRREAASLVLPTRIKKENVETRLHSPKKEHYSDTYREASESTARNSASFQLLPIHIKGDHDDNSRNKRSKKNANTGGIEVRFRYNQSTPANVASSDVKLEEDNDEQTLSESSDEETERQGVPKFGGILLPTAAKKVEKEEFEIVSNQFKNSKPVRADSDNESTATDEIITASKAMQKETQSESGKQLSIQLDKDHKKQQRSKRSSSLEMDDCKTNKPKKLSKSTEKPSSISKGVLGRLEGFSSVWQDDSENEHENDWKNKLELENSKKREICQNDADSALCTTDKMLKLNQNIETELPTLPEFGLRSTDKFNKQREGKPRHLFQQGAENEQKHAQDNYKRLESMKRMQDALAEKRKTIEVALSTKGEQVKNKRIKFDSDGEEEFGSRPVNGFNSDTNLRRSTNQTEPKVGKKQKKDKQLRLFDEDDNDETEENMSNMFELRPQFEGAAGEKLFKLQSRFGDDKRFAVDERFLEDASDSENSPKELVEKMDNGDEFEDEKSRHLHILQNVIGNDVGFRNRNKLPVKGNSTMLRYDPSKEDHSQYEIKAAEREAGPIKKKKTLPAEPEPLPVVSKDTFYEVSDSLKNILDKKASGVGSFSLLKAMGRDQSIETENTVKQSDSGYDGKMMTHDRRTNSYATDTFKYDSSEDEDQAKEIPSGTLDGVHNVESHAGRKPKTSGQLNTFFFQKDDPRLAESVSFFRRTETLEELQEKWKTVRSALYEDLLTKSKRSVRRKAPKKEKKGSMPKRRFKQSSRKQRR